MCTGEWSVAGRRTVDTGEQCHATGADNRAWKGAEDCQHGVPGMGRGTYPAKRRGRGGRGGAEDKDSRAETVRSGAVNDGVVAAQRRGRTQRVWTAGRWCFCGGLVVLGYEAIYPIEIMRRSRRGGGGGGWRRIRGLSARAGGAGGCRAARALRSLHPCGAGVFVPVSGIVQGQ
jgi:hypothetical protein